MEAKWHEIEKSIHPHHAPSFYDWIIRNEAEVMKKSMIASVRQDDGLGNPPAQYTTNKNESINRITQQYCRTDGSYATWVQLSDRLYDLIIDQHKEIEKAIYGMGEYKFKESYQHLEIESAKWFKMTPDQRRNAIRKVMNEKCILYESQNDQPHTSAVCQSRLSCISLSVQPDKSGITNLSPEFVMSLWRKAERLLNMPNGVCEAPGMADAKCVASEGVGRPHVVIHNKQKKGMLSCDDLCLGWKAQRICSHVLAAAESMGCLGDFLQNYKGHKTFPNFTATVTHGISKGVGKKPGKTKRKGPANLHRPEIETVIDPFESSEIHAPISTSTTPEISSANSGCDVVSPVISSNQIMQLNVSATTAISSVTVQSTDVQCRNEVIGPSRPNVAAGPFQLKFLTPLIKVCAGCRKPYNRSADGKSPPPPMDLILVRKEQHMYYNNVYGRQQLSSPSNVHYHANLSCLCQRCPNFDPNTVEVPDDVQAKLLPIHMLFLVQALGVTFN